jgi:TonB family protein
VSTRSGWVRRGFAAAAGFALLTTWGFAQTASTEEGKRKVKSKVAPVYPELAKRMNVTGKVKMEVVIAPDGRVKSVHPLGGHPLLIQACQDAVKEWKFMPAPEESTQVVEFSFTSSE